MKNVCLGILQDNIALSEYDLLALEVHVLQNVEGAAGVFVPLDEAVLMFQH